MKYTSEQVHTHVHVSAVSEIGQSHGTAGLWFEHYLCGTLCSPSETHLGHRGCLTGSVQITNLPFPETHAAHFLTQQRHHHARSNGVGAPKFWMVANSLLNCHRNRYARSKGTASHKQESIDLQPSERLAVTGHGFLCTS